MTGLIYTFIAVIPVAAGMVRSRQWMAAQLGGRSGVLLCTVGALAIGLLPALLINAFVPDSWPAMKQHVAFTILLVPLLALTGFLLSRGSGSAATEAVPAPVADPEPTPRARAGAPVEPGPRTNTATRLAIVASPGPAKATTAATAAAGRPAPRVPLQAGQAPATRPGGQTPVRRSAVPASVAPTSSAPAHPPASPMQATAPAVSEPPPPAAPATVTECILTMSISCEEYLLRNFEEMTKGQVPDTQRATLTRLIEETDDKLARLHAALKRHHGEELVRVTWSQLPEVDLPVFKPGSTAAQVREKSVRQTQVMIDFYRTVASYVQRPSLKSLLVNLALDGQRHLAVIEQTTP